MKVSVFMVIASLAAFAAHAAILSGNPPSQSLLANNQRLQTHRQHADPTDTNASTVVDPDAAARSQFIRKCVVAFSVNSKYMLPVSVAEKFCDSTDAIVECKLQLSRKLLDVHKQEGDMSMYCVSVYEWFQQKYGMHCPEQCHKLQCVSTCNWLKDLHRMEEVGDKLDVEIGEVSTDNTELKNLQIALKEQTRDVLERNRTVSQRIVELDRANTLAQDSAKALGDAQKRSDDADSALEIRNGIVKQKKQNISDSEAELTALHFKLDKATIEQEGKQSDIARLDDNRAEIQEKIGVEEKKLKDNQAEAKVLQKMADVDTWKAGNLSEIITAGNETTASFQNDYEKAKADLKTMKTMLAKAAEAAKANGSKFGVPEEVMEEQEDLVKQTKGRVVSSTLKTSQVIQRQHEIQRTVDLTKEKIKNLEDTMANTKQRVGAERAKLTQVKDEIKEQNKELTKSAADIQSLNDEADGLQSTINSYKKEMKTQDANSEAEKEVQDERHAALQKAKARAKTSDDGVSLAQDQLRVSRRALEESVKLLKKQEAEIKDAQDHWNEENAGLLTKVNHHKDAMKALERRKPEIVRQHSLALWQMSGFF